MFVHIHVDNGLIMGESDDMVEEFLTHLSKSYSIKTKKKHTQQSGYILSWKPNGSIIIHQQDFSTKILDEFKMMSSRSIKTPDRASIHNFVSRTLTTFHKYKMQKAIGMLSYLALHTEPDIIFTTNLLSQFVNQPTMAHWSLVKHLLQYLKGTRGLGLHYTKSQNQDGELMGWADSHYATSLVTKKSQSGYLIMFFGNPIA
ncbi:hypothetical protein O181_059563 [Austropuccinia psidii MF-1]|uniref:Reverse transcriptase Ty1/copia-type domain-containing protein n=1 Tax=Austropuccinia psidii MF-1 TaxID=1389203 RepID=A0A9Q3HWM3_9BASI|nr:hypothetical protein [Austropuccinia psidii MF-1]